MRDAAKTVCTFLLVTGITTTSIAQEITIDKGSLSNKTGYCKSTYQTALEQGVTGSIAFYCETTIDRPAKKIWPHLLNFGTWMEDLVWNHLSGEPNTEGELQQLYFRAYPPEDLINGGGRLQTLHVVPEQYYMGVNPIKLAADDSISLGNNII